VHGDVDPAVEQGIVDLLGEQALAADIGQGHVEDLVAGGLDDDDLQGALLSQLGEARLRRAGSGASVRAGRKLAGGPGQARARRHRHAIAGLPARRPAQRAP
jgi:hypothetical protein